MHLHRSGRERRFPPVSGAPAGTLWSKPTAPERLQRSAIFIAIFVVAALPALVAPVLPMIDYYSHVARYFVLAHVDTDPYLARYYVPHWAILPNIGLDVLGAGLMRFLPPLAAAKLIVLGIFAVQYWGVLAFNRQLNGRASIVTAILAAPLLYSFILGWGFANFLLGLGLVFWAAAWRVAHRRRLALAVPVACVFAVLIFLTHGVAFALYGLLLGGLELGFFLTSRSPSLGGLARQMAALAVQAVAPAVLFLASPTSKAADGVTNADEAIRRLGAAGQLANRIKELVLYRATSIVRVSESPSFALDILTFAAAAALLGLLTVRGRLKLPVAAWPAIAMALVLVAVVPPALFGVGYVADRMPLYLAFLLAGSLVGRLQRSWLDIGCISGLALIVGVKLACVGVGWQGYRQDYADFEAATRAIPAHSLVGYVNAVNQNRLDGERRCQMWGPLVIPLHGQATSIFAYKSQQPIALAGRLDEAAKAIAAFASDTERRRDPNAAFYAMADARLFDFILVCGPDRLRRPNGAPPVVSNARFAVYRVSDVR
jgi:hypothetical protein